MDSEIVGATEIKKEIVSKQPKKEKSAASKFFSLLREVIAALFWIYVLLKLFIFDVDVYLVSKYLPNYAWLLNFKFFILIGAIAIIWLVTKNKYILFWSLYILFYPAILLSILLWKISLFVFKQKSWIFAFALINAVISFFRSIKYNFIVFALFLVSLVVVFGFSNKKLLWLSTSALFIILLIIYIHRFILVFKPSSVFQTLMRIFSATKNYGAKQTTLFALDENIKNLPVASLDQKQLEKWTANLQNSVLFNRICLFAAKKLRDYQNSGFNIVSYILTILLLIVLTIFSFATINFGLFKINNDFFSYPMIPNFFTFFYYSFNNLVFNSIKEIAPSTPIAQSVFMVELFFALFLVAIFISLLISIKSQRHTEELNEAIKNIKAQGTEIEGFIKDEYKINSIKDANGRIRKIKSRSCKVYL